MARKRKLPRTIETSSGELYCLVLFKVHTKDEHDRPEDCTLVANDRVCEVVGGEEFMTAYVPRKMMVKR